MNNLGKKNEKADWQVIFLWNPFIFLNSTEKPKSLSSSVKNDFLGSRGAGDDDLEEIKHPLYKNNVEN